MARDTGSPPFGVMPYAQNAARAGAGFASRPAVAGTAAGTITRAGLPTAVPPAGTGLTTTAFEPIFASAPIVKPPSTLAPAPTITPRSSVGCRLAPRVSDVPPSVTP